MARGGRHRYEIAKRGGCDGGISFQLPKGWDDGSGKIKHVKGGQFDGRVYWTSRHEAKEIAKRLQDREERHVKYDPD